MSNFKIVSHYTIDEENNRLFYAVKRLRWFLIFPYWSFRAFKSSNDHCYTKYIDEAKEIIKNLK